MIDGKRRPLRLLPLLLAVCLLLAAAGCGAGGTEQQAEPTPAAKAKAAWQETLAQYETDGWVITEGTTCSHGDPFHYTDMTAIRTAADGSAETLHLCNYKMRTFY